MIVYELYAGARPFADKHPTEVPALIKDGKRPPVPANMHYTIAALIIGCWRQGMCSDVAGVR